MVPDNVVTVATGGLGASEQCKRLSDCGFDSVCLGRALAVHPDPKALVKNIRDYQGVGLMPGMNGGAI